MVQLSLNFLKNSNLFSNHYLESLIQQIPEWEENEATKEAFNQIKQIYENKKGALKFYNEPQLEEFFIRPIFKALGHHYGVQAKVERGSRKPDYGFFPDEDALLEALKNQGKDDFYIKAVAIGDAKSLKVSLDKKLEGKASFEYQNPSFQIDTYLRETPPKWGILTNGRYWRLYNQETSYKLNSYYEIDLFQLLETNDVGNFKYFYLFFRLEAFLPGPDGKNFLDRVYEGSTAYAQELGESLQENVYRAMKILAEGFLSHPKNNLAKTEANINLIHENALKLLYRLLFIFYAESRGLLDTSNKAYEYFSLDWIKRDVADKIDKKESIMPISTVYWGRLKDLFDLINVGSESREIPKDTLYIPPYNGGLFDPERNHFLEEKIVGDSFIAEAVDLLARSEGKNGEGKGFVDYSTLDIRHLGSIYERLLEYKLRIAEEELVAVKAKGKETWIPKDKAGSKIVDEVKPGDLYLATVRGERKATGSYYTPDYIVKYIVENTLGPLVEEKVKKVNENGGNLVDEILSIKVLDPAMGSGHFLVEATDFLAKALVEALGESPHGEYAEEINWARREVVRHCIYGVDLNPMAVELAKLSLWLSTVAIDKPLTFLDHRLKCGNSLIGAHLSDLKYYPSKKKIGEKVITLPSFISPVFIKHLIGKIKELEGIGDEKLEDIKRKESVFAEFKELDEYKRAKAIANVHTAVYFGNEVTPTKKKSSDMVYHDLFWAVGGDEAEWRRKTDRDWFKKAQEIAEEKRFFHWELEFPEIFFEAGKEKNNPGFDVVVGNPPYIRVETLDHTLADVYDTLFYTVYERCDIYVAFVELSFQKINTKGRVGLIVSNQFMVSEYGLHLRELLSQKYGLVEIIDFTNYSAFLDISTYSCILIGSKHIRDKIRCMKLYSQDAVDYVSKRGLFQPITHPDIKEFLLESKSLSSEEWAIEDETRRRILDRIKSNISLSLGDISLIGSPLTTGKDNILYGEIKKEYNNEIALIFANGEEKNLERQIWKKILRPKMIKKWIPRIPNIRVFFPYINKDNRSFELIDEDYFSTNFPKNYEYLIKYKDELLARKDSRKTWLELNRPWYSLHRVGVPDNYLKPKILVPSVISESKFCYDENGLLFPHGGIFGITPHDHNVFFLLGLLNSSLTYFFLSSIAPPKRGGYISLDVGIISKIPIRIINFKSSQKDKNKILTILKKHYFDFNFQDIEIKINGLLPKDEEGNFITEKEKSDVIHDLLAFLAEKMIEMNKEKNAEIKGFLKWLETETGAKIDDMSNKTAINEYYTRDFETLIGVLKKNKSKLQVDPSRRDFQEKVQQEYNTSLSKLEPLLARIEATDSLIDQLVYKLYGLTDEEIKIVEEASM